MRRRSPGRLTRGARSGPGRGLGSRDGGRIDVDSTISFVETDPTMGKGEKSMIPAHSDVLAGLEFGAALADDDRAGWDGFPSKTFNP